MSRGKPRLFADERFEEFGDRGRKVGHSSGGSGDDDGAIDDCAFTASGCENENEQNQTNDDSHGFSSSDLRSRTARRIGVTAEVGSVNFVGDRHGGNCAIAAIFDDDSNRDFGVVSRTVAYKNRV